MGKFMEKYPPLNNILWSVFAGSIYAIIYRYLFSHWAGLLVVVFAGIAIVYYFFLGVTEMVNSLQEKKAGVKDAFSFVVELIAFIASLCAILDALLEVIV